MIARVAELQRVLGALADLVRAEPMAAYMKGHFVFLGLAAPVRKKAARPFIAGGKGLSSNELMCDAEVLWALEGREYQSIAADYLRRWVAQLDADALVRIRGLAHEDKLSGLSKREALKHLG